MTPGDGPEVTYYCCGCCDGDCEGEHLTLCGECDGAS